MSADPTQIAQLLAMYRQQFPNGLPGSPQAQAYGRAQMPGEAAMGMGNAPAGTNAGAGGTNALAKLVLAMLQRKRMADYKQQYPQGTTAMGGGTTPPSAPLGGGGISGGTDPNTP